MENQEIEIKQSIPPKNILKQSRYFRTSNIFFNLSVTSIILVFVALLSTVLTPLLYFFAVVALFLAIIMLVIFTLGIVFAVPGGLVQKMWSLLTSMVSNSDTIMNITKFCFNSTKWLSIVGVVASVLSIVFIALSKVKNKVWKIILLGILIVIFCVVFVFQMMMEVCNNG